MKRSISTSLSTLVMVVISAAGCTSLNQPYRGQEQRTIKALSQSEASQYLAGAGMGTARAAELNGYPGPMHVLQLADALALDKGQLEATQSVYRRMHERARVLGRQIVEQEERLDRVYASGDASSASVGPLVREIAGLLGEFRFAHLEAHLSMHAILNPAQISQYDALRGYAR